jgi:hypothetical protein
MVSVELIDELKKRANISYTEAKDILEKHNGDILESLITIENQKKSESTKNILYQTITKFKKGLHRANRLKLIVVKDGKTIVKLPFTYVIMALVFGFYLTLISIGIIFVTKCRVKVKGE